MTKPILSLQKCSTYEQTLVDAAITRLLEPLGGIKAFVRAGHRVLIKPNMLSCKDPDKAATTHPAVIEAVAESAVTPGPESLSVTARHRFLGAPRNSGTKLVSPQQLPTAALN